MNSTAPPLPPDIEQIVDAFESARQLDPNADIADFLPPPGDPRRVVALRELVRIDLDDGWSRGTPPQLDALLARFPEIAADPATLGAVVYEEFRQRRQAGDAPDPEEYRRRYGVDPLADDGPPTVRIRPKADDEGPRTTAAAVEMYRVAGPTDPAAVEAYGDALAALPDVGDEFLGFRLNCELGRGAFGRVFLAQQIGLADRPVALKVATELLAESQTLASLQHTNIMPIFSAHRAGAVQAVCMPYFGRTTLADVLKDVRGRPSLPTSGRSIVSTLNARRGSTLTPSQLAHEVTETAPALDALEGLARRPYVGLVLWLGARLADGLQHAHERGIVHRDLKPANVLIADDGRPMLLDFNLSANARLRGGMAGSNVGGTLPYMAPEQLQAFLPGGDSAKVDPRSDVYALGIILFELLTGHSPFSARAAVGPDALAAMIAERSQPPPRLRTYNPEVSPATEAIIRRCLDPDPAARYQSARHLEEDLDAQLDDRPLVHTPEPWGRERLAKWARRHPRLSSATSVTLLASIVLLALGTSAWKLWQEGRRRDARESVRTFFDKADAMQADLVRSVDAGTRGRALEQARAAMAPFADNGQRLPLDDADRQRLRSRLGEVLFLMAHASTADDPKAAPAALALNERAEALLAPDPPHALLRQRAKLLADTGDKAAADEWIKKANAAFARTAQDHYFAGLARLERGEFAKAAQEAEEATRLDPRHVWAWYLLGHCRYHVGLDAESVAAFSVCLSLNDRLAKAHANRGRVHMRSRRYELAIHDFDRAVALDDGDTETRLNRAQARLGVNDLAGAEADLTNVLAQPEGPTRAFFLRADVRERRGDAAGAAADRAEGLKREPTDVLSWVQRGLARFDAKDVDGALADFGRAESMDPRSYFALQNRAYVYETQGRTQEQLDVTDRLLSYYPQSQDAMATRAVLLARLGRKAEAKAQAEACLALKPGSAVRYQIAGAFAQSGDAARARKLVGQALMEGAGYEHIVTDPDLDPLRQSPEFQRLLTAVQVLRESAAGK